MDFHFAGPRADSGDDHAAAKGGGGDAGLVDVAAEVWRDEMFVTLHNSEPSIPQSPSVGPAAPVGAVQSSLSLSQFTHMHDCAHDA